MYPSKKDTPVSLKFVMTFFWEFTQNFPLLLGFMLTLTFMQRQAWGLAFLSSLVGSVIGAMLIRYTETQIVAGERESVKVTWMNIAGFLIVMLAMSFYYVQQWGSWWTDTFLGMLIGFGIGYGQDLAAGNRKPGLRHILALSFAFVPALWLIRWMLQYSPWFTAFVLCMVVTGIIVLIDYDQAGQTDRHSSNPKTNASSH